MKKLVFLLLVIMCLSCAKKHIEPTNPGNVTVTLDYVLPSRSGDITAKGESAYLDFYTKYISSKILTPKTYSLTFTGLNLHTGTGVEGEWGSKHLVSLPPDRYAIEGTSSPLKYTVCGDTCYLKFHDTINITHASTNITLKAYYNCSLILLDTTDVKNTTLFADTTKWTFNVPFRDAVKTTMMKTEEFYHTFLASGPVNGVGADKINLYLNVTSRHTEIINAPSHPFLRNKISQIVLWLYIWEEGKYYYFENTDTSYTLTPMTGN